MVLVKAPVPAGAPCAVLVAKSIMGLIAVFQTTPYWVALGTPREVMLPLPVAVVVPMEVTAWVVTVGGPGMVKVTSAP